MAGRLSSRPPSRGSGRSSRSPDGGPHPLAAPGLAGAWQEIVRGTSRSHFGSRSATIHQVRAAPTAVGALCAHIAALLGLSAGQAVRFGVPGLPGAHGSLTWRGRHGGGEEAAILDDLLRHPAAQPLVCAATRVGRSAGYRHDPTQGLAAIACRLVAIRTGKGVPTYGSTAGRSYRSAIKRRGITLNRGGIVRPKPPRPPGSGRSGPPGIQGRT